MLRRTTVRAVTSIAAVSALAFGCLAAAPGADANTPRKTVPNTKPMWLSHASHVGTAAKSAPVNLRVYLAPRGGLDNLTAAVKAVSTPGTASYRHFISPDAYKALYAPTDSALQSVESWLGSSGLKVTGVEANRRYVSVSGTVAAAQKAFGVSLQRYRHDGQSVTAPSTQRERSGRSRRFSALRVRPRHHRAQGRPHLGGGRSAPGRIRQRAAVLAVLRADRGQVPG